MALFKMPVRIITGKQSHLNIYLNLIHILCGDINIINVKVWMVECLLLIHGRTAAVAVAAGLVGSWVRFSGREKSAIGFF